MGHLNLNLFEKISLYFITCSFSKTSQQIFKRYYLKLNKIALKQKFKMFKKSKYKFVRRRKQKKKIIKLRYVQSPRLGRNDNISKSALFLNN